MVRAEIAGLLRASEFLNGEIDYSLKEAHVLLENWRATTTRSDRTARLTMVSGSGGYTGYTTRHNCSEMDSLIRQRKHLLGQPATEFRIVAELLEQLRVVLQHGGHNADQGLIMFDARILAIGMLSGVLIRRI